MIQYGSIRQRSADAARVWVSCSQSCCAWRKATWERGWSDRLRLDLMQEVVLALLDGQGVEDAPGVSLVGRLGSGL